MVPYSPVTSLMWIVFAQFHLHHPVRLSLVQNNHFHGELPASDCTTISWRKIIQESLLHSHILSHNVTVDIYQTAEKHCLCCTCKKIHIKYKSLWVIDLCFLSLTFSLCDIQNHNIETCIWVAARQSTVRNLNWWNKIRLFTYTTSIGVNAKWTVTESWLKLSDLSKSLVCLANNICLAMNIYGWFQSIRIVLNIFLVLKPVPIQVCE